MIYTLKELVDVILSSLDSDEVNSISDTTESNQVALLLKSVYYDIATDLGLPEHETLIELVAPLTTATPTIMTVPSNTTRIDTISYDRKLSTETNPDYYPVAFCSFQDFVNRQQGLRNYTSGVGKQTTVVEGSATVDLMYYNDRMPSFYTVIGDDTLIFDGYDSTIDSTLQSDKTLCQGALYPAFTLSDTFTPDLDPTQFSYYLNKAKVRAFAELKQAANNEAADEARRQRRVVQNRQQLAPERPRLPTGFGRK